jgi:recyclin-1
MTAAIGAWANESKSYDYSAPGFSEQTGHFTQLVWKATRQLGCAVTNCSAYDPNNSNGEAFGWFVVCEYAPPGNVVGDGNKLFTANVLPPTSGSAPTHHILSWRTLFWVSGVLTILSLFEVDTVLSLWC